VIPGALSLRDRRRSSAPIPQRYPASLEDLYGPALVTASVQSMASRAMESLRVCRLIAHGGGPVCLSASVRVLRRMESKRELIRKRGCRVPLTAKCA